MTDDELFDIAHEVFHCFPRALATHVPEIIRALVPALDDDELFHATCQFDAIRQHVAQFN